MDSNHSNITASSTGDSDHFFPTSTHFFDPLGLQPTFLDDSPTSTWPPQQQQQQQQQKTNIHPTTTTSIGAVTTKNTAVDAAPAGPTSSRPSKKRSRASRRAPTTVLTTDTSNFRAMVQEFTGIPAPPFVSAATSLRFPPRPISMFHPLPPPHFMTNKFQPAATSDPVNFQSLLQSQLLMNLPQPAAPVTIPSSGELSLPGVIVGQQQQQLMDPTLGSCKLNFPSPGSMAAAAAAVASEFRSEKGSEGGGRGDALLESWMSTSSDS